MAGLFKRLFKRESDDKSIKPSTTTVKNQDITPADTQVSDQSTDQDTKQGDDSLKDTEANKIIQSSQDLLDDVRKEAEEKRQNGEPIYDIIVKIFDDKIHRWESANPVKQLGARRSSFSASAKPSALVKPSTAQAALVHNGIAKTYTDSQKSCLSKYKTDVKNAIAKAQETAIQNAKKEEEKKSKNTPAAATQTTSEQQNEESQPLKTTTLEVLKEEYTNAGDKYKKSILGDALEWYKHTMELAIKPVSKPTEEQATQETNMIISESMKDQMDKETLKQMQDQIKQEAKAKHEEYKEKIKRLLQDEINEEAEDQKSRKNLFEAKIDNEKNPLKKAILEEMSDSYNREVIEKLDEIKNNANGVTKEDESNKETEMKYLRIIDLFKTEKGKATKPQETQIVSDAYQQWRNDTINEIIQKTTTGTEGKTKDDATIIKEFKDQISQADDPNTKLPQLKKFLDEAFETWKVQKAEELMQKEINTAILEKQANEETDETMKQIRSNALQQYKAKIASTIESVKDEAAQIYGGQLSEFTATIHLFGRKIDKALDSNQKTILQQARNEYEETYKEQKKAKINEEDKSITDIIEERKKLRAENETLWPKSLGTNALAKALDDFDKKTNEMITAKTSEIAAARTERNKTEESDTKNLEEIKKREAEEDKNQKNTASTQTPKSPEDMFEFDDDEKKKGKAAPVVIKEDDDYGTIIFKAGSSLNEIDMPEKPEKDYSESSEQKNKRKEQKEEARKKTDKELQEFFNQFNDFGDIKGNVTNKVKDLLEKFKDKANNKKLSPILLDLSESVERINNGGAAESLSKFEPINEDSGSKKVSLAYVTSMAKYLTDLSGTLNSTITRLKSAAKDDDIPDPEELINNLNSFSQALHVDVVRRNGTTALLNSGLFKYETKGYSSKGKSKEETPFLKKSRALVRTALNILSALSYFPEMKEKVEPRFKRFKKVAKKINEDGFSDSKSILNGIREAWENYNNSNNGSSSNSKVAKLLEKLNKLKQTTDSLGSNNDVEIPPELNDFSNELVDFRPKVPNLAKRDGKFNKRIMDTEYDDDDFMPFNDEE